jgi:hypothetical protein
MGGVVGLACVDCRVKKANKVRRRIMNGIFLPENRLDTGEGHNLTFSKRLETSRLSEKSDF